MRHNIRLLLSIAAIAVLSSCSNYCRQVAAGTTKDWIVDPAFHTKLNTSNVFFQSGKNEEPPAVCATIADQNRAALDGRKFYFRLKDEKDRLVMARTGLFRSEESQKVELSPKKGTSPAKVEFRSTECFEIDSLAPYKALEITSIKAGESESVKIWDAHAWCAKPN